MFDDRRLVFLFSCWRESYYEFIRIDGITDSEAASGQMKSVFVVIIST